MNHSYDICLADYEPVLPEIARIIGAHYEAGSFTEAEDMFHARQQSAQQWHLKGERGELTVTFEAHEGYYFSRLCAAGTELQEGKQLLWNHYLSQGGNPDKQEKP